MTLSGSGWRCTGDFGSDADAGDESDGLALAEARLVRLSVEPSGFATQTVTRSLVECS